MHRSSTAIATIGTRSSMLAHVLVEPGRIELRELLRPSPGPGEVVLRIRAALTCGTDVKAFLRGHPKFPMPTPFGHEFAGEVAEVGAQVKGVRAGDAVMATPTGPCGSCYHCRRRQENLCDTVMETITLGAYAEYIKLPERVVKNNLYAKPPELSFAAAALLEPLSCVMHGLETLPLEPDDTVILIGAGAISLLHLLALRALGTQRIAVLGRSPERAAHARRLGAEKVFIGGVEAAAASVRDYTDGRGADVVIECTGQVPVWEAAPSLARRGGTVVLFGGCAPGTDVRLDTQRLHYDELRVYSPFHSTPRAVRRAYELLCSGKLPGDALITGAYPLPELPAALEAHRLGLGIKFVIHP
ncbi:MAG: alcohol dehydrogenase catalytic domain-containing protein [Deltaproteobacteria bacterium]|nr:alcohol dehydrogenase catalytic domain-containing protein [Deltaproteobacteria bacterium]